jgi:hypothetical protein
MRHCYVSFYFCCYNRCQQAPSRGSPPPPYDSSTRPLSQSCYTLQLGKICSPIPPLPLILLPYIITVFPPAASASVSALLDFVLTAQRDFPQKSRYLLFLSRKRSTFPILGSDRDGYVRLKLRFPRSPGRARGSVLRQRPRSTASLPG